MLELAILGLLKERSMHGYELKKQLGQRLGFFWTVSFGSLYPTLKKLERKRVVERLPGQGSRRKHVYRITAAGEEEFLALLEDGPHSAWEDEKFPLRLAFFQYLRPETRIRLLERRKQTLEDRLAEGRRSLSAAGRRADGYTLSLMRHGVSVTEHDIAWLDELITAERSALEDAPGERSGPGQAPGEGAPGEGADEAQEGRPEVAAGVDHDDT